MTLKEMFAREETWHRKAVIVYVFHNLRCHQKKGWTISKTAKSLGCSIGYVSENLRLVDHPQCDKLKAMSRNRALKEIKHVRSNLSR